MVVGASVGSAVGSAVGLAVGAWEQRWWRISLALADVPDWGWGEDGGAVIGTRAE